MGKTFKRRLRRNKKIKRGGLFRCTSKKSQVKSQVKPKKDQVKPKKDNFSLESLYPEDKSNTKSNTYHNPTNSPDFNIAVDKVQYLRNLNDTYERPVYTWDDLHKSSAVKKPSKSLRRI